MTEQERPDEEVQAAAGQKSRGKAVSGGAEQREAAGLVESGDRGAAGEGGPEHPADAAGAAAPRDGDLSDGDGQKSGADGARGAEGSAENADGDAAAAFSAGAEPAGGDGAEGSAEGATLSAGGGTADAGGDGATGAGETAPALGKKENDDGTQMQTVSDPQVADGMAGDQDVLPGADVDVGRTVHSITAAADEGQHGSDGGDAGAGTTVEDAAKEAFLNMRDNDPVLFLAVTAYGTTIDTADTLLRRLYGDDEIVPSDRKLNFLMFNDMAAYVRKIGRRCTADVMGQQLKILKWREHAELSKSETVAVAAFIATLLDLDEFEAAEMAAIDKATRPAEVVPPLPIEDTTLETVGGMFETWA